MLWTSLRFSKLPLEIFLRDMSISEPLAVFEDHRILHYDHRASLRGLHTGMSAAIALALAPTLLIKQRNAFGEKKALIELAGWAAGFTPLVTVEYPDTVLLEFSGSLKLLGGLEIALGEMQIATQKMGFSATIACAPTFRAALWLARSLDENAVSMEYAFADSIALEQAMAALPLSVIQRDADIRELKTMGVIDIAGLLRLPREGLIRRSGPSLMHELDCALGKGSEAHSFIKLPTQFQATLDLLSEVNQTEAVLFATSKLFVQLACFLDARCAEVKDIKVKLAHREKVAVVTLSMASPSREAAHFTQLLHECLARLTLTAPVLSISVSADTFSPSTGTNLSLVGQDSAVISQSRTNLIERLRARLGNAAVHRLARIENHRPEEASVTIEMSSDKTSSNFYDRPFWFTTLRPLEEVDCKPYHNGPLNLLAGPERIDSGWWHGSALRDYFIARDQGRSCFWLYRDGQSSLEERWFLTGVFS